MSVNYTVFLYDDFDWHYANGNKEYHLGNIQDKLEELIPKDRERPKLVADFPHFLVFHLSRQSPQYGPINEYLKNNFDIVYFNSCHEVELKRLELE